MSSPAMKAVHAAKKAGRLPLPATCEACGRGRTNGRSGGMHYHHWSYLPEHHLDVIPLCIACHRRVHNGKIPEPRTGRVYVVPTRPLRPRRIPVKVPDTSGLSPIEKRIRTIWRKRINGWPARKRHAILDQCRKARWGHGLSSWHRHKLAERDLKALRPEDFQPGRHDILSLMPPSATSAVTRTILESHNV